MTSRRKLEEEIARTKDPVVRKQLQELLDKRETKAKAIKDTITKEVEGLFEVKYIFGKWTDRILMLVIFAILIAFFVFVIRSS